LWVNHGHDLREEVSEIPETDNVYLQSVFEIPVKNSGYFRPERNRIHRMLAQFEAGNCIIAGRIFDVT
jgi:hypothetical protein